MDDVFLTPKQAAAMLNLSAYTIRAYARQGIIPAQKVGRGWRFSQNDLLEWLRLGQGNHTRGQDGAAKTLRVNVPHGKEHLVFRLDEVANALGRPKNELVLEALERFLAVTKPQVALPVRKGKVIGQLSREEIYGGRGLP